PPPRPPVPAPIARPPVRAEPAPVRLEPAPMRLEPAPAPVRVRPPATFGASMLQARKGRPNRDLSDRSAAPSDPSWTFGASMLQAKKSRAKYFVIVLLVLAGIAALGFSTQTGSTSHPSAAAPHKG